jgi:hypothetical protein
MRTSNVCLWFLVLLVVISGCATQPEMKTAQGASTYWPLDYAAGSYADPIAVSPVNDHTFRWLAYAFHPLGVVADYAINRPIYTLVSAWPGLFGYTSEDAGLHSSRASVFGSR